MSCEPNDSGDACDPSDSAGACDDGTVGSTHVYDAPDAAGEPRLRDGANAVLFREAQPFNDYTDDHLLRCHPLEFLLGQGTPKGNKNR